jgi:hypothetical protein
VDSVLHAETGYDLGTLGASLRGVSFGGTPRQLPDEGQTNGSQAAHDDEEVTA